ncbi:MAG: IS4 family transposase [Candidatus Melainabacteria bacterium]|nr:IS4 family transposase [Candidatus Melainabacteria bacterium]
MTKPALELESNNASARGHVDISLLKKHVPLRAVNSILKKASKESIRQRFLPAQVMVYYVIAMTMFMDVSLREVVRLLFPPTRGTKCKKPPVSSAITQARQRLGSEPLKLLYQEIVKPIATKKTRGAWFKGLRLVAIDGSTLSVADTLKNKEAFGKPKVRSGIMAFPRIFMVSLVEVGTRVLFASTMGPSTTSSEMSLAKEVASSLSSGMLCLADRYYCCYPFWKLATEKGADLLFRARADLILPMTKILPDGSYLSHLYPSAKDRQMKTNGIAVRVIEYRMPVVQNDEPFYRLITTILDHKNGTAAELAALYEERWQIETAYDELKTHLRGGADVVLRSKTPDLVKQEFYGLLLAYFSLRAIMHEAAVSTDDDPDRLSFVHALRVIKRHLPQMAACSPRKRPELHKAIIAEILQERVVIRITRTNHRGIKRKSSHPVADRSKDRKLIMPICNFIKILKPEKQKNHTQIVN